jgi:hypothetical protein
MSNITKANVIEGFTVLEDTNLDELIDGFITEAEDIIIAMLSYLSDIEDLVRPTEPTDTAKAIDLLVLYKARELAFTSVYGSLDNQQVIAWMNKFNAIMSDIRKGYIEINSDDSVKSMASAVFG